MGAALGIQGFGGFANIEGMPKIDLTQVLHGEEEIQIIKPLLGDNSKYVVEARFLDFQDKGKMTIMIAEKLLKCAISGDIHVRLIDHTVIRGMGGYGYKGTLKSVLGDGKVDRPAR